MEISVVKYTEDNSEEWDDFVINNSCNGTFLQSRKFLNYHREGRFADSSLVFYSNGRIVGVCPGCEEIQNGDKIFFSHAGSTYGGIVINESMLRFSKLMMLMDSFERWLINNGYTKCVLKQQNPLMCTCNMDLIEFVLFFS